MMRSGQVTFVNAEAGSPVRVAGARIAAAFGAGARDDDLLIDLQGDRLLPGLINSHDHLQLNHLPPLPEASHCSNAREWIAQVNLHRHSDPDFAAHVSVALSERLLMGGMKNLLSGVTTVAHHDPLYGALRDEGFPVRVVENYGWSHSLYIDGEQTVRSSCWSTPLSSPWIIHAAEGVDAEARGEFDRLEALGCLRPNTVLVHGVALDAARRARLQQAGAGLIWCPASNLRLFGTTIEVSELARHGCVALGTDSRLSGSVDLLCELRVARTAGAVDEEVLESMVTRNAATLLKLPDRGRLEAGALADLLVLPAGMALSGARRADIRLVMIGGRPLYADPDYARLLAPPTHWAAIQVDGRAKMLEANLAGEINAVMIGEPGVSIPDLSWRAA